MKDYKAFFETYIKPVQDYFYVNPSVIWYTGFYTAVRFIEYKSCIKKISSVAQERESLGINWESWEDMSWRQNSWLDIKEKMSRLNIEEKQGLKVLKDVTIKNWVVDLSNAVTLGLDIYYKDDPHNNIAAELINTTVPIVSTSAPILYAAMRAKVEPQDVFSYMLIHAVDRAYLLTVLYSYLSRLEEPLDRVNPQEDLALNNTIEEVGVCAPIHD